MNSTTIKKRTNKVVFTSLSFNPKVSLGLGFALYQGLTFESSQVLSPFMGPVHTRLFSFYSDSQLVEGGSESHRWVEVRVSWPAWVIKKERPLLCFPKYLLLSFFFLGYQAGREYQIKALNSLSPRQTKNKNEFNENQKEKNKVTWKRAMASAAMVV